MKCLILLVVATALVATGVSKENPPHPAVTAIALPGAPADGVALDYLACDRAAHRVWVPAGGTGNAVVIDAKTRSVTRVEGFPTAEVERRGKKRLVGLSSATIGNGYVYLGNRADSSVCAVDASTLARAGCVTLPSSPDGVVFISKTNEVWVTAPRDRTIVILDVAAPAEPKLAASFKLEGDPEGYAVDVAHGAFYTNLEDQDKTLRIDIATRKVSATWKPACGEEGPRGLALDATGRFLMVACTQHIAVLDTGSDGKIVSTLKTGDGVDNLDYLATTHSLYAAAGASGTLTVATLNGKGALRLTGTVETAKGARNAVAAADGTAFIADGPEGKILIVEPVGHK